MALGYKHYTSKLWKTRAILVVLLAACVLVSWSVFTRFQVEREMAARRAAIEAEYQALSARYAALQADVEYLQDERSLEAEIRKHFDVARVGESVVIILDNEERPTIATTTSVESETTAWWQFWR